MDFWQILNFSPRSPWAQASCGNGVLDLGLVTLAAHGAAMPTWALSPRRHKLLTPPLTNTLTLTHSKTLSFLTNRMVQNMAEVNLGVSSSLAGRIYVFRPSLWSVHQAWSRTLVLGICMLIEKKSPKHISKKQKVSYYKQGVFGNTETLVVNLECFSTRIGREVEYHNVHTLKIVSNKWK